LSLEIHERDREGICVLDCKGRVVLGAESEEFRDRTRALIESGKVNMILTMKEVEYIDSTGLGELVALAQATQRASGQVKLVELSQEHTELLVLTKLTTVFSLYNDEQDAVNSFFPDRQISSFDLLHFVKEIKEEQQ